MELDSGDKAGKLSALWEMFDEGDGLVASMYSDCSIQKCSKLETSALISLGEARHDRFSQCNAGEPCQIERSKSVWK